VLNPAWQLLPESHPPPHYSWRGWAWWKWLLFHRRVRHHRVAVVPHVARTCLWFPCDLHTDGGARAAYLGLVVEILLFLFGPWLAWLAFSRKRLRLLVAALLATLPIWTILYFSVTTEHVAMPRRAALA